MVRKILDSKIVRIISTLIEWVIGATLVVLVCLTLFQSISKQGDFFGYRVYIVGSESMVPLYYVGDTLLVKEMPVESIDIGDTVTYVGRYEGIEDLIITHQLKRKEIDENGNYLLHIKGIANDVEDPIVYEDQLLGKVVHKFFILSLLGKIITNTYLTIICITVPIVLLIVIEIIKLLFKKDYSVFVSVPQNTEELDKKEECKDAKKKKVVRETESLNNGDDTIKASKAKVIKIGDDLLELPKTKKEASEKIDEAKNSTKKSKKSAVKIKEIEDILDEK